MAHKKLDNHTALIAGGISCNCGAVKHAARHRMDDGRTEANIDLDLLVRHPGTWRRSSPDRCDKAGARVVEFGAGKSCEFKLFICTSLNTFEMCVSVSHSPKSFEHVHTSWVGRPRNFVADGNRPKMPVLWRRPRIQFAVFGTFAHCSFSHVSWRAYFYLRRASQINTQT